MSYNSVGISNVISDKMRAKNAFNIFFNKLSHRSNWINLSFNLAKTYNVAYACQIYFYILYIQLNFNNNGFNNILL